MANSSALIPRDSQDGDEITLPVDLRSSSFQLSMLDTVGPGRLLHQAYSVAGRRVEKTIGHAAHKLGLGPGPTTRDIENKFGNGGTTRQSMLDTIYDSFRNNTTTHHGVLRALKKDCKNLLEYALPSETPTTRIQAFRNIIVLTTRHPGLRRIFLESSAIKKLEDSPNAICRFWKNSEYNPETEARFTLEFAAHCLAKCDINVYLEGIRPTELGCASEEGMGVVDTMLVRYCDGAPGFPRLIAIRYLAGILELPAFWLGSYHIQKDTMDKLCKQALRLIEDINPDSVSANDFGKLALLDPDGIDALAEAILVGGEKWIQQQKLQTIDYWLSNFIKLIKMLRGLILPNLLPNAYRQAARNWEACLKGTVDQLPASNLDYHFEDVHEFVSRPVGLPAFGSNWEPSESDITEEINTKLSSKSNLFPSGSRDEPSVLRYSFFRPLNNANQRNRESKIQTVINRIEELVPGVKFRRVDEAIDAVIRITFDHRHPDGNTWSYVGREAEGVGPDKPTMNLSDVTGYQSDEIREGSEEYGDIMHQFFHALGMRHQHQHPERNFTISATAVIKDLVSEGWSKEDINDTIVRTLSNNSIDPYPPPDNASCMNYHIRPEWTKDGTEVKRNNKPSDLDLAWLNLMYPPRDPKIFEQALSKLMNSRISEEHRNSILKSYLDGEWDRVRSKIAMVSNPKSKFSISGVLGKMLN